ncbi:MAG: D-alanyl-D-alanine carboxypeptidase, partial [Deltaproteobacteria bacterium]|nr:D-alanyl-D-alanine carboxypeptidase [Deltaproteobacteria bacterium]
MKFFASFTFFLFSLFPSLLQANSLPPWSTEITSLVQKGGVYAESSDGKVLFDYQGSQPFVPASTMKIPTAYAAMELLGKDYKFKTEFYMDGAQNLYVKGYGDPYLVSEELDAISGVLKSKGVKKVNQIIL